MYLQRLLQIAMATLAALGALLLGMGQRSAMLPLVVATAAFASVWVTDVAGWFRLGRMTGNIIALAAALLYFRELSQMQSEVQALAIANLLVCLQIVLMFQKKETRTYWELATVSLLEVVIAAAFYQGVSFGVVLVAYMLVGFFVLWLIHVNDQAQRHLAAVDLSPPPPAAGRRWPLAAGRPVFADQLAGGPATSGGGIDRELALRMVRVGLGTLVVTAAAFFVVPRLGGAAWRGPVINTQHVVGFDRQVTLGELGEIIQNPQEVMRLKLVDQRSGRPCRPAEVYLYGGLLLDYAHGQWKAGTPVASVGFESLVRARGLPADGIVRQECTIEPLADRELFAVSPVVAVESNQYVFRDHGRRRLMREKFLCGRRFSYVLGTTALRGDVQSPLVPGEGPGALSPSTTRRPPVEGPDGLPGLVALADRWIKQSGLPTEDRLGRARWLERMLSNSTRFGYSLEGQNRDPAIDPIEDFVMKNPRGHCEYFATALTLMLRSQGIPARMVVGYKCDEWNDLGEFYQVRQLHAHTWVEAYLRPSQLPSQALHGQSLWRWQQLGGWLRLDPTPWMPPPQDQQNWLLAQWTSLRRRIDYAWANYVVEMDRTRQQEAIYRPLVNLLRRTGRWIGKTFTSAAGAVGQWLANGPTASWLRLGLMAAAVLLVGLMGWVVWRLLRRRLRRSTGLVGRLVRRQPAQVEFYHRLETLLARQGFVRRAGQTQREFALAAGPRLAEAVERRELAVLPGQVAEVFYRVRFGGQPLDSLQSEMVEHALAELDRAAARKK